MRNFDDPAGAVPVSGSVRPSLACPVLGRVLFCLIPLLAPMQVFAEPAVRSVELDNSSSSIIISGADFGSRISSFALSDTVDDVLYYREKGSFESWSYDNLWQRYGTDWAKPLVPRESRTRAAGAGDRGMVYYGGPGRSNNSYYKPISDQDAQSLYVAWLYNPSENPGSAGGSNKFIRIWDDHDGEGTRISWTQMHMIYSGSDKASWHGWQGNVNGWNLMEIYVDSNSNSIKAWVNGSLEHNVDNFVKQSEAKGLNVRQLGFDPSYGDRYPNFQLEIDNVYVAESPARVVMSREQYWDDAQYTGESIISTEWGPTKIVAQAPQSLGTGDGPFYVFVVDPHRKVNERGYRVCPKCPNQPVLSLE